MRNRLAQAMTATLVTFIALFSAGTAMAGEVLDIRLGVTNGDATRIVVDLSERPDYAISGADAGAGRITIEVRDFSARAASLAKATGHVSAFSIDAAGGGAIAVFDLRRTAAISKHFLIEPNGGVKHWRLVIDLETADKAAFLASLPERRYETLAEVLEDVVEPEAQPEKSAAVAAAPVREVPPAPQQDLPIIVIDAGHGGGDPGAQSASGVKEKDVTLAAARALSEILAKTGRYKVVLTRAGDTRLDLQDRSRIAREAGAKLFISLHADALDDASIRGGSVYTVNDAGLERSAREALSQPDYVLNGELRLSDEPVLGEILLDVTQNGTKNESGKFAEMLVANLDGVTPLLKNAHRRGDLFVLLSPDVPAVLFELAFISNKNDVVNLTSEKWRKETMAAVARAIDEYFEARRGARHAALAPQRSKSGAGAR